MKLINYLKGLVWTTVLLLLLSLWVSLFYYYQILSSSGLRYAYLIVPLISVLSGGFVVGRNSKEKGFLEGLKVGIIYLGIVILCGLLFHTTFNFHFLIYSILLLLTTMLGSMIGINFKKRNI